MIDTKETAKTTRFLRLAQIVKPNGPIPVTGTTWWNWCSAGHAPKPIKLGPNTTVWREDEVQAFIDRKMRGEG